MRNGFEIFMQMLYIWTISWKQQLHQLTCLACKWCVNRARVVSNIRIWIFMMSNLRCLFFLCYEMYYKDSHWMNCCLNIDLGHVDCVYLFCAYFYLFTLCIIYLLILNINVLGLIHTISYYDTINYNEYGMK